MHISHLLIIAIILSVSSAPVFAKSKKISICHKGQVISVSTKSLNGHNNHGDTIGTECPVEPEPVPEADKNAVLIMHCEESKVYFVDFYGIKDQEYNADTIEPGDSCAESVSKIMDDGYNLRNVEGVGEQTEYMFTMKY